MSGGFLSGGPLKGRSELWLRTVSAAALGALALFAAWAGGLPMALLWALGGAVAAWECLRLIQAAAGAGSADQGAAAPLACGAVTFVAALLAAAGYAGVAIWAGLAAATVAGLAFGRSAGAALGAAAAFAAGALLAVTPPAVRADPALGLPALLWMFAVVWATDIGAYFAGKTFGGPKLWPAVSPGKTWSGFFGGALCGCLAGVLVLAVWAGWSGAGWIALASLVASVAGQGGDLAESALKRRAGVKDSARIIPGHGGVLDRLDAFWAVCLLAALARAALHLQRAG